MTKLIFGHRGAKGTEPENTLRSFTRAIELGVDGIELDVHRSKDGELVVIHDSTLERTTTGGGKVSDHTIDELKTLDAGRGEKIPVLAEVLALAAGKVLINVELKGALTAEPVAALINEQVESSRASYDDFIVSSFNHRELLTMRRAHPRIRLGALFYGLPADLESAVAPLRPFSVHPSAEFIDAGFVDEAHKLGLKVFVYTVNEPQTFHSLMHIGADGVFTDFPERFVQSR
ncbi:MAG: glycerophosphodiester phosphodiesterase family protein [Bdellovibrionota bacterium]